MVIGYKYIELQGSSCFVYDDSRKCDGKWAVVVMVSSLSKLDHIHKANGSVTISWPLL